MDALTPLKKGKDAVFDFVGRTSRSVFRFAFAVTAYFYLNVLLLGLSSHPRIAYRTFDVINSIGAVNLDANNSWDNFVKFVLNDCKVACALCSFMLMTITLVSAATYHSDPITCQINLVAVLPPAFGIAQVFCIMWHLESTSKYPNAPLHWKRVTACNSRSPFIKTTALLAAPVAWVAWSMISFIMILYVILFRGLPIPPFSGSEGPLDAGNWIIETFNLIFSYGVGGTNDALVHLSVASRVCATIILTIGCVHLAITVLYFTRLCLPREVPSSADTPPPSPGITAEGPSPAYPITLKNLVICTELPLPLSPMPSPSPDSGVFVSARQSPSTSFLNPTSTIYIPYSTISTSETAKSPLEPQPPPSAADIQIPPKAVIRETAVSPVATAP